MNIKQAINRADELRPNAVPDSMKASWIYELEGKIAEMMELPHPKNSWPADSPLLMPAPDESIYELYLMAKIDLAQQDNALYLNDMAVFNGAYSDARCRWRRGHAPQNARNWEVI